MTTNCQNIDKFADDFKLSFGTLASNQSPLGNTTSQTITVNIYSILEIILYWIVIYFRTNVVERLYSRLKPQKLASLDPIWSIILLFSKLNRHQLLPFWYHTQAHGTKNSCTNLLFFSIVHSLRSRL